MEQELLNEQNLPEEGVLNSSAAEPETADTAANVDENVADIEVDEPEETNDLSDFDGQKQVATEDYSKYDRPELLKKLNQLINDNPVETIVFAVEEIKSAFYKKYRNDYHIAREKFIEQNGAPESFKFADEHQEVTFKEKP